MLEPSSATTSEIHNHGQRDYRTLPQIPRSSTVPLKSHGMLWVRKPDSSATQKQFPNITHVFSCRRIREILEGAYALKTHGIERQREYALVHEDRKPRLAIGNVVNLTQFDSSHQSSGIASPTSFPASVTSTSSDVDEFNLFTKTTGDPADESTRNRNFVVRANHEAHAALLAAFDAALKRKYKENKLELLPESAHELLSSPDAAGSDQTRLRQKAAEPNVRVTPKRPVLRPKGSLDMHVLTSQSTRASNRKHFSTLPLPPLPTKDCEVAWRAYQFRPHAKTTKRKPHPKSTQPGIKDREYRSYRRASCPPIHLTTEPAKRKASIEPTEEDYFTAWCTFRWLFKGRRFCDPNVCDLLKRPGSTCLSLDQPVIDFQLDFPHASEVLFESSSLIDRLADQPKFSKLPYKDNSFDVISGRTLTASIPSRHWLSTLAELKRVLRPGGRIELLDVSTEWLSPGPLTTAYEQSLVKEYSRRGLLTNILDNLPLLVQQSRFEGVKAAFLAIPVHWGGSVSRLWEQNIEPLATVCEAAALDQSIESRCKQRMELETEIMTHRSLKVIMTISATK